MLAQPKTTFSSNSSSSFILGSTFTSSSANFYIIKNNSNTQRTCHVIRPQNICNTQNVSLTYFIKLIQLLLNSYSYVNLSSNFLSYILSNSFFCNFTHVLIFLQTSYLSARPSLSFGISVPMLTFYQRVCPSLSSYKSLLFLDVLKYNIR